jgi:TRAP-type uncharacterized transport system substrate-binding protein
MRQSMILATACGALAVVCLGAAALFFVERPTVIRVAVAAGNRGDENLLAAAGKVVRHGHHPIRFKVQTVSDLKAAAAALDEGRVDMAVVRTDGPMPAQGQTVIILHRDAAVLVAPGDGSVKLVTDLAGRRIGLVGDPDVNERLLDTILGQYEVARGAVTVVPLQPEAVRSAVESKAVDAVLVVGIVADDKVQGAVHAVAKASTEPPVFLAVPEAAAIAQREPAFESLEVVKGAFSGVPPEPADEFDTLSITHRLVASSALSDSVVADVTRFFLSDRSALAAVDPMARRIEAPSTDKGSPLPAHPGTAAYIDDEEESFLDQYSDWIYLAAMFFGVLASGGTAVFSRLNAQGAKVVENLTVRLLEIMKLVRLAPSLDLLEALEAETDEIVMAALGGEHAGSLDERRLSALGLALDQVRAALRDRRGILESGMERGMGLMMTEFPSAAVLPAG